MKHLKKRLVEQERRMEILRENLHSADKSLAEANSRNEILREFKNSCTRIYQQNMHIQQTMENVNTTVRSINKDRSGGLIEASEMIRKVEERQEDSSSNMIKATKVIMGFMDKKTTEFAHYCNQAGVLRLWRPVNESNQRPPPRRFSRPRRPPPHHGRPRLLKGKVRNHRYNHP